MTENRARAVAEALGGEAWQSGGNIWLVRLRGMGGRMVVISEDMICEYRDEETLREGRPAQTIQLGPG